MHGGEAGGGHVELLERTMCMGECAHGNAMPAEVSAICGHLDCRCMSIAQQACMAQRRRRANLLEGVVQEMK